MDFREYFIQKKEFYDFFMIYFDNENVHNEDDYDNLINYINAHKIQENNEELKILLRLIQKFTKNFHRYPKFFEKINKIISNIMKSIKKKFSNLEIFNIFSNNKQILLFLIQNKIIEIDNQLINLIFCKSEVTNTNHHLYFYPEIKPFLDQNSQDKIQQELLSIDPNIMVNFDQKRQEGENDSFVCKLIRNDSIEDFISYVNQSNINLSSSIKSSLFETNDLLIKNETSLIEYSAFFGSIQIFQYLKINNVDLTPSLWIYAIHGRKAEIIHLLEENHVKPPDDSYEKCLEESIKCHHNEIANYILQNIITQEVEDKNIKNDYFHNIFAYSLHYYNYSYVPNEFNNKFIFIYLCQFDYTSLVKFLLNTQSIDINYNVVFYCFIFSCNSIFYDFYGI